jgi:hypothetical protein
LQVVGLFSHVVSPEVFCKILVNHPISSRSQCCVTTVWKIENM